MTSHSTTNNTLIASSCLVVGVSLVIFLYDRWNASDNTTNKRIKDDVLRKVLSKVHTNQNSINSKSISPHLDRDFRKEQRRKRMIPVMAMKKPMYDNILMKSPRGEILSTISLKKANWYIRKNLAAWETPEETSIQLLFEPNQERNSTPEHTRLIAYNQSIKRNCCVACGCDENYRRHYIVPYAYRARFPPQFKTHMPHDVVILCPDCHTKAQSAAQIRMQSLEDELRMHLPNSRQATFLDATIQATRSAASALLKRRKQLPSDKVLEYEQIVRAYYNITDEATPVTVEQYELASRLEARFPNPDFVSGPELVERHLVQDAKERGMEYVVKNFVKEWRVLFQRTLEPQFLPSGWDIDSPVRCESRPR